MKTTQILKVNGLTKNRFEKEFLQPNKPVIITDLMNDWAAKNKWTFDYFKYEHGDIKVPVYSSESSKSGQNYMKPVEKMPFKKYLEAIEAGRKDLRLFIYNIAQNIPTLKQDYQTPTITDGFINEFPFLFFGSADSKVVLHYDIDLSHVFLSQFVGRKEVLLFAPDQSKNLYHLPFSVASQVDLDNPDYEKYPALRNLKGYKCIIEPGDTLFIPSGYWHYITYLDAGFSMSQRANQSIVTKAKGLMNIAQNYVLNQGMNRVLGRRWRTVQQRIAKHRAEGVL